MKNVCDCVWSDCFKRTTALITAGALLCLPLFSQDDDDEEVVYELSPFEVTGSEIGGYNATSTLAGTRIRTTIGDVGSSISVATAQFLSEIGATVGGAQDVNLLRKIIDEGLIPPPDIFTPEGLFSEHDLPIGGRAKDGWLFDIATQATVFESWAQPDVEVLVQLGFVSGIDANTFKPQPLNLVAVVDKSGSMSGEPLDLVRSSLKQVVSQMGSNDQLSIVLYGSDTHVHLQPTHITEENRAQVITSIEQIQSRGSTYMEAGLKLGYEVAEESKTSFEGLTRVMLFTDERPNVGRTDEGSFMQMAEAASERGIGMTTIGVGIHFGAELAEKISSVRGGNLFFFDEDETMQDTFRKEFDTMVLELAYDMELKIFPAKGVAITGLYGIPGDAVEWNKDGSLSLGIATIFASRNKGAIYFGLGSEEKHSTITGRNASLATSSIVYTQADNGKIRQSQLDVKLTPEKDLGEGIIKGTYLVDQYASLKLATKLYEAGEYQAAANLAERFANRSLPLKDSDLEKEREMSKKLAKHLAIDCEERGINLYSKSDENRRIGKRIEGEWIEQRNGLLNESREILRFTNDDSVELYKSDDEDPLQFVRESEYQMSRKYIVFDDCGRSFRYNIKDNQLILKSGDRSTVYFKKTSLAAVEKTNLIRRIQKEISGLPGEKRERLLSSN